MAAKAAAPPDAPSALCKPLRREELRDLVRTQRSVVKERGAVIVEEGDRADRFFVLNSGAVSLQRSLPDGRRQIFDFLWRGDVFGVADADRYAYTAVAIAGTSLCAVTRLDLDRMMESYPDLAARLMRLGNDRLVHGFDRMTQLGQLTATEKLASFLLDLSEQQRRCGGKANPVWLPMSSGDIADYLGLRIETVSRRVSAFAREGLIAKRENQRIELLDRARLTEIAEGGGEGEGW